ncbi:hypothetical protein G6F59_016057 [Rhizopus arrhizus]|nr:hypothetical protein G6F59_016057 [Rhizopus arrhizus]
MLKLTGRRLRHSGQQRQRAEQSVHAIPAIIGGSCGPERAGSGRAVTRIGHGDGHFFTGKYVDCSRSGSRPSARTQRLCSTTAVRLGRVRHSFVPGTACRGVGIAAGALMLTASTFFLCSTWD